jgi:hypothetical protein
MNPNGGFYIDRRFRGVGRIQKSSRTDDLKTFRAMLLMLEQLHKQGDHDILRRIKDGKIGVMEVYTYWRSQKMKQVPRLEDVQQLDKVLIPWAEGYHEVSEITRRDHKNNFRQLLKFASPDATAKDLPDLLEKYRKHCAKAQTYRVFNYTRSSAQAYLRDTLGQDNALWLAVRRVKPLSAIRKREGNPPSPRQMLKIFERLPSPYEDLALTMYLCGMNWKEYVGEWSIEKNAVHIAGTKREGRDRRVPYTYRLLRRVRCGYKAFRLQLAKASDGKVLPGDLRRGFAHLLEQSGIPRTRRRLYLGHRVRDVSDLYETHDVRQYLMEDAIAIRKYVEAEHAKSDSALSELEREYEAGFTPSAP